MNTQNRKHRTGKPFEELTLADDFMFGKVMMNKEICKKTLEILLGITIEEITVYPERQKVIDITYEGKSVRLDVYASDSQDVVYDAEMQQKNKKNQERPELPKRSRYYQGMIDMGLIEKGSAYQELNECYVIFICTFDPFGKGQYRYTFRNMCEEVSGLRLEDMTTKVFLNTKGTKGKVSEELKTLLSYVETQQAKDSFTGTLDQEVNRVKQNLEWRQEYMKSLLWEREVLERGREEGREEGRKEGQKEGREAGIKESLKKTISLFREFGLSDEEIQIRVAKEYQLSPEELAECFR